MTGEAQTPWQPKLHPDLRIQVVDGEAIVLDRSNERVHQLNQVGTFILERCDGTRTEVDIVSAVVERFDVSDAQAAADTADLLARMRTLEILV